MQDLRSKDQGPRTKILDLRSQIQGLQPKNNIQYPRSNIQGQGSRSKIQEPMCSTIQELKPNYPGSKLTLKPHDPRSKFQDTRPKAQVHKFQKPICHDPKSIYVSSKIRDPRTKTPDPPSWSKIQGPKPKAQYPRTKAPYQRRRYKIQGPRSNVQDPRSKARPKI